MSNPPKSITDKVDDRDGRRCVRCHRSLAVVSGSRHHRMRRRDGGHSVAQLVLLCGSGTTGCHGWVHGHVKEARALGLILPALRKPPLDPEVVPVRTLGGWVRLVGDLAVPISKDEAAVMMRAVYGDEWDEENAA